MHGYKVYLIFIYLFGIRLSFCTPETPKTVVNYNLRNLKQFGNVAEVSKDYRVKLTTFTPGDTHSVARVFYDTTDVWTLVPAEAKTVKRVVVTEKANLVQLVHLEFLLGTGTSVKEDVYYKKQKTQFTKLDEKNYKAESIRLVSKQGNYVDNWFLFDFDDKESYSRVVSFSKTLLDGVWKSVYSFNARPYVFKYQGSPLWTLATDSDHLTQLEKYDLDDTTSLLLMNLATSDNLYYVREGATGPWKPLTNGLEFDTKVKEFKSRYFTTGLEFQLATHPDYEKFLVNRSPLVTNVSDLTVQPLTTYFFNKLKYNDQELWSSTDKNTRAFRMKLILLSHEVKLVQLFVTKGDIKLSPEYETLYFHKDSNAFRKLDRSGYRNALNQVKSLADKTTGFTYNKYWLQKEAKLDLASVNEGEFTVQTVAGKDGVVTKTLTPGQDMTFSKVVFGEVGLWPTGDTNHNPSVKKVVFVTKNNLLQLVHVLGTKTTGATTNDPKEDKLFVKKVNDGFSPLEGQEMFDKVKAVLEEEGNMVDKTVHLDVNQLDLDPKFFTVTNELVDGVDVRVVTVNGLKVTKLTNFSIELWGTHSSRFSFVSKFEMYSVNSKKLLKVFINTENAGTTNVKYFSKEDEYMAFVALDTDFTAKLLNFKMPSNWQEVTLDVGRRPNPDNFNVEVATLSGNRTKLTLRPLFGKKVTAVTLGTHNFFTSTEEKRVYKLEMHLEGYEVKFLKFYVWKDGRLNTTQMTDEAYYKFNAEWVKENFEDKLNEFLTQVSQVAFTYDPDWEVPPTKLDPQSFNPKYFNVAEEQANVVKTTTYTPKEGTVVNEVTLEDASVWVSTEGKKMVSFKVFTKNDMVQLLHLNVVTTGAAQAVATDLFFKKVEDRYEALVDLSSFNALRTSLDDANTYVDDKVKLDLSSTAATSTKLFDRETTLEDGVEKTVVVVKAGKLFEVRASPPLWKSTDGAYVTKLERYIVDDVQFLVLYVQYPAGKTETLYFEKPVVPEPPPAPEEPAADPAPEERPAETPAQQPLQPTQPGVGDGGQQPTDAAGTGDVGQRPAGPGADGQVQQQLQPQQPPQPSGEGTRAGDGTGALTSGQTTTGESLPAPPSPPARPAAPKAAPKADPKPSFLALVGRASFFEKLNRAKAAVKHTEVTLNVTTYQSDEHFEIHQSQEGTARLFKMYPKKTFLARGLFNGTAKLWEQEAEGERMVEAFLYLHEGKVKFVRGVVWEKDHTDQSQDKLLHFQLVDGAYVAKEKAEFDTALQTLTTVEPTPLRIQTVEQPPPTAYVFNKLFLSDTVDTNIFKVSSRHKYEHTLRTYTPKEDKFINLVETKNGVLWKAEEESMVMRDAHFILKDEVALGHITVKDNAELLHLFFKFERQAWKRLTSDQYVDLHTKFYDGQSLTSLLGQNQRRLSHAVHNPAIAASHTGYQEAHSSP